MPSQRPSFRFITKNEASDNESWREPGTAWKLANSENFSVRMTSPSGEVFRCLMVENKPEAAKDNGKQSTRPGPRRTGAPQQRPSA